MPQAPALRGSPRRDPIPSEWPRPLDRIRLYPGPGRWVAGSHLRTNPLGYLLTDTAPWLEIPQAVTDAADTLVGHYAETYEPPAQLAAMAVPSLIEEGRQAWEVEHRRRERGHIDALQKAIRAAAPDLHEQVAARFDRLTGRSDDTTIPSNTPWESLIRTAVTIRSYLGEVAGWHSDDSRRHTLPTGNPVWLINNPHRWWDDTHETGRALNAHALRAHPEWEPRLATPQQAYDTLLSLGARPATT